MFGIEPSPGGAVAPPAAAPPALQIPADQCERSGVAKLHALLSARVNRTVKALEKPQRAAKHELSDDCCWRGCERLTELMIDAVDYGIQAPAENAKSPPAYACAPNSPDELPFGAPFFGGCRGGALITYRVRTVTQVVAFHPRRSTLGHLPPAHALHARFRRSERR